MVKARHFSFAVVLLLTLLGFALRLYRLNAVALRGDEAFTVIHWMREPLGHTLATIATTDPQPPLAYATFRLWALLLGATETTARLLPALLGILGVPAIYALGRRLGGTAVGLVAAFLWAVHPYAIWHAQDARNYALWSSTSLVAAWLAVRALQRDQRRDWIIYVVAAAVAAYFYYLELFTLAALTLFAFTVYWGQWRRLLHWIGAMLAVGLILAPWFIQPRLLTGSGYGGTTGGFEASRIWLDFLPTLTFGQKTLPSDLLSLLWVPITLTVVAALLALRRRRLVVAFVVAVGAAPLLMLALVSLKLHVFETRYILGTAPAYILLFSALIIWIIAQRHKVGIAPLFAVILFCLWLGLDGLSLRNYYLSIDYAKAPDWRGLAAYLSKYAEKDDLIVQASADEAFNLYADEYGLTEDRKQLPAGTEQSSGEIVNLLNGDEPTHHSFWRVGQSFTDWPNYGVVESWLNEHMQRVLTTSVTGLPPVQRYMPWQPEPVELAPAPLATFGDIAELVGAKVLDPAETAGKLTVWLYWHPLAQSKAPLKVFVQMIGAPNASGSPLWTQDDHYPQIGRINTTQWSSSQTYRDVYELPLANVPSGDYTIITGLYDPGSGTRLTVGSSDYFTISPIHLSN